MGAVVEGVKVFIFCHLFGGEAVRAVVEGAEVFMPCRPWPSMPSPSSGKQFTNTSTANSDLWEEYACGREANHWGLTCGPTPRLALLVSPERPPPRPRRWMRALRRVPDPCGKAHPRQNERDQTREVKGPWRPNASKGTRRPDHQTPLSQRGCDARAGNCGWRPLG